MRKISAFLVQWYLAPLRLSKRLSLYAKGKIFSSYDEHFVCALDVIRRLFPEDKGVVADIGAFDGDSTIYFARELPKVKILGFEPNPVPFQRSLNHLRSFSNIEFFPFGFSDKNEETDLFLTSNLVSSSIFRAASTTEFISNGTTRVKLATLDDFFESYDNILLMKLDVQGAELKILSKGEVTLRKTKLVLTEMLNHPLYEGSCYYFEVDQKLREAGFKIHTITSDYNADGTRYFDVLYINTAFVS